MPVTLRCTVCGTTFQRPPSHAAKIKEPTCSRRCNGMNRGRDWAKHGHKGAAARTEAGKASAREKMSGDRNPAWGGGTYIEPGKGYRMIHQPDHPRARANGYVLEHILVAEQILGRPLREGEEVHHRNRDRADNRPENLQIFEDHRQHWMTEHYPDVVAARDAANSRKSRMSTPR